MLFSRANNLKYLHQKSTYQQCSMNKKCFVTNFTTCMVEKYADKCFTLPYIIYAASNTPYNDIYAIPPHHEKSQSIPYWQNFKTEAILKLLLILTITCMHLQYLPNQIPNSQNSKCCHSFVYTSPMVHYLDAQSYYYTSHI